jgi:hypothetical protein
MYITMFSLFIYVSYYFTFSNVRHSSPMLSLREEGPHSHDRGHGHHHHNDPHHDHGHGHQGGRHGQNADGLDIDDNNNHHVHSDEEYMKWFTQDQRSNPHRWLHVPSGWYDDESYDDIADHAKCQPISPEVLVTERTKRSQKRQSHNHNNSTNSTDINNHIIDDIMIKNNASAPWWYAHISQHHKCGTYRSMRDCHSTTDTCQWTLQGYCINYSYMSSASSSSSSTLSWWQFDVVLGGLTNQHWSALRGLMIARYAQQQLMNSSIIVATLVPRVHRQSITRGATLFTGNCTSSERIVCMAFMMYMT